MFLKNKRAQQIVEYVLVVGVVIAALVVFTRVEGPFRTTVQRVLNMTTEQLNKQIDKACIGPGCGPMCGNGICDITAGERCDEDGTANEEGDESLECLEDCGRCSDCGNGSCESGENCSNCPGDCGSCTGACGDGHCDEDEHFSWCPDCPVPDCGNGRLDAEQCDSGEFIGQIPIFEGECPDYSTAERVFYENCGALICNPYGTGEGVRCTVLTTSCCYCGDDAVNGREECDGVDFGDVTCASLLGAGYVGNLKCSEDCTTIDTSGCGQCGDGIVNTAAGEECDGSVPEGARCDDQAGYYGDGSTLTCQDCKIDYSLCERCGDGIINGNEDCDGSVPPEASCAAQGYDGGTLHCSAETCKFDTVDCYRCGDGHINTENNEECDGADLGGQTCASLGIEGDGVLVCNADCTLNTDGCLGCGDGTCTEEEKAYCLADCGCYFYYGQAAECAECRTPADGGLVNPETGEAHGWDVYCVPKNRGLGPQACGQVSYDTVTYIQLDGERNNYGDVTEENPYLPCECGEGAWPSSRTLVRSVNDRADCCLGVLQWGLYNAPPDYTCVSFASRPVSPQPCCGDGVVDAGEDCEPTDDMCAPDAYLLEQVSKSCKDLGFTSGTVHCYGRYSTEGTPCTYDTSGCVDTCGNGTLDTGEECDGSVPEDARCDDEEAYYGDGTNLKCNEDCDLDYSDCLRCGDGIYSEEYEDCEPGLSLPEGASCETEGFAGGTLACQEDCSFDTSGCHNCGNGLPNDGEDCDPPYWGEKPDCWAHGLGQGLLDCYPPDTDAVDVEGNSLACKYDTSGCTSEEECYFILEQVTQWAQCGGSNKFPGCEHVPIAFCERILPSYTAPDGTTYETTCVCPPGLLPEWRDLSNWETVGDPFRVGCCTNADENCPGNPYQTGIEYIKMTGNFKCIGPKQIQAVGEPECLNHVIEGDEQCEPEKDGNPAVFRGNDNCQQHGYESGTLRCDSNCVTHTDTCYNGSQECSNGVIEGTEECELPDKFKESDSCSVRDYDGGELMCSNDCKVSEQCCFNCSGTLAANASLCPADCGPGGPITYVTHCGGVACQAACRADMTLVHQSPGCHGPHGTMECSWYSNATDCNRIGGCSWSNSRNSCTGTYSCEGRPQSTCAVENNTYTSCYYSQGFQGCYSASGVECTFSSGASYWRDHYSGNSRIEWNDTVVLDNRPTPGGSFISGGYMYYRGALSQEGTHYYYQICRVRL